MEKFDKKEYLKDTSIFLFSDHENNMIGIYNIFQFKDYAL